jgi:hypothetical protein
MESELGDSSKVHAKCSLLSTRRMHAEAIQSILRNGCHAAEATSINRRASLVPAAAVIPAPRVYVNIAAVKTLVVYC